MDLTEKNPYWKKLELAMAGKPPVIVPPGIDDETYFETLRSSIRQNAVSAEQISAIVKEPGFGERPLGSVVTGYLLAKNEGYWLVYEPNEDEFYCFWGLDKDSLGAYGVSGHPVYCWWG